MCRLLLRLWAWMMHAMLDGVLIGSAEQLAVIIPLSFAILVCAMQDVAGLYIYFNARGATTRFVAIAIVLFAVAFPIGAGISLVVFRVQPRPPSGVGRPEHVHPTQHGRWRPSNPSQGHGLGAEPKPRSRSRQDSKENALVLDVLRCVMAGLFVYMALFELAPPHAHGRGQNLKYFVAFSFGLLSAYMADVFEDSMHSHQGILMAWIS